MHDRSEGPTSGNPTRLSDLTPAGESLLPPLPVGLGAVRSPRTTGRLRRELCRRPRHLLPARERTRSIGDDAAADDTARADGERNQDAAGTTAGRKLRLSRL